MIVPRFTQEQCLILTDSDVESLLAAAMASEQQAIGSIEPSMLCPAWWATNADELDVVLPILESSVTRQGDIFGLRFLPEQPFYPPESVGVTAVHHHAQQTRMLQDAAYLAMQSGIKRVIWPIRIPESQPERVKEIGNAIDRAMLISRLVTIDADQSTAPEVVIETPFIDLSDEQILELSLDMSLPIETCWWSQARDLDLAHARVQDWHRINSNRSAMPEPKPNVKAPS